jgi:photosystem II stability/assembly factor-like uncharacterized protein
MIMLLLVSQTLAAQEDTGLRRRQWRRIEAPVNAKFETLFFLDAQRGWALGRQGVVIATTDGGKSWQLMRDRDDKDGVFVYEHLYFKDARTGWIGVCNRECGTAGPALAQVYATADGGKTWERVEKPSGADFEKFMEPRFFETSMGERWARSHLDAVYVGKAGTLEGRIASLHASLEHNKDLEKPNCEDVSFATAKIGCLTGYDSRGGFVLRTEDGGKTWTRQASEILKELRPWRVGMASESEIFVAAGARLIGSRDGGKTWREEWKGEKDHNIMDIRFPEPGFGVVVGYGGLILRYSR